MTDTWPIFLQTCFLVYRWPLACLARSRAFMGPMCKLLVQVRPFLTEVIEGEKKASLKHSACPLEQKVTSAAYHLHMVN